MPGALREGQQPFRAVHEPGGRGTARRGHQQRFLLSGRERWSDDQHDAFLSLGWEPPTGSPEEATPAKQPEGSANYLREFKLPVDAAAAASLDVATLANVMAIPHPGFLA